MNWLLVAIIFVILVCAIRGLQKGLIRVIFSLISVVVVLIFVSFATPYISNYIEKNTSIYQTIQGKCETYLQKSSDKATKKSVEGAVEKDTSNENTTEKNISESSKDSKTNEANINQIAKNIGKDQSETITDIQNQVSNLKLPAAIQNKIIQDTTNAASTILDESGIYKSISQSFAHIIVSGISFFLAFIAGVILINLISGLLDIVSHLPVLHGLNRLFGGVAGTIEGFIFVWIFFYLVALCASTAFGRLMIDYIDQSVFLTYLYHNNGLLQLIGTFIFH